MNTLGIIRPTRYYTRQRDDAVVTYLDDASIRTMGIRALAPAPTGYPNGSPVWGDKGFD